MTDEKKKRAGASPAKLTAIKFRELSEIVEKHVKTLPGDVQATVKALIKEGRAQSEKAFRSLDGESRAMSLDELRAALKESGPELIRVIGTKEEGPMLKKRQNLMRRIEAREAEEKAKAAAAAAAKK